MEINVNTSEELKIESRITRKKEATKQNIINVAMNLITKQGFNATTMEQIARDADIAKGTLYNYFPVKEAILDEYIKKSFREGYSTRITALQELPDTRSRLIYTYTWLMNGVQAQKDLFEKYLVYRMQILVSIHQTDSEKSGFYLISTEIINLGQKCGEIRTDLPLNILVELCDVFFVEIVKQFYLEPEMYNAQQTIERCVDLFLNGIKQ